MTVKIENLSYKCHLLKITRHYDPDHYPDNCLHTHPQIGRESTQNCPTRPELENNIYSPMVDAPRHLNHVRIEIDLQCLALSFNLAACRRIWKERGMTGLSP